MTSNESYDVENGNAALSDEPSQRPSYHRIYNTLPSRSTPHDPFFMPPRAATSPLPTLVPPPVNKAKTRFMILKAALLMAGLLNERRNVSYQESEEVDDFMSSPLETEPGIGEHGQDPSVEQILNNIRDWRPRRPRNFLFSYLSYLEEELSMTVDDEVVKRRQTLHNHLLKSTGMKVNNTTIKKDNSAKEGRWATAMEETSYLVDFSDYFMQIHDKFRDIPTEYMDRCCYSPIRWLLYNDQSEIKKLPCRLSSREEPMKGRTEPGQLAPKTEWEHDGDPLFRLKNQPPLSVWFPSRYPTQRFICLFPIRGVSQFVPVFSDHTKSTHSVKPSRSNSLFGAYSPFTRIAFLGDSQLTRQPCWKPLLDLKWRTHARQRFYTKWGFEILQGLLFAIATSPDVPLNTPLNPWNLVVNWLTVILSSLFLIDEIRQFIYLKGILYVNLWNAIDLGSYIIPLVACARNLSRGTRVPSEWVSFGLVFVWTHFLQNCRVFKEIGWFASIVLEIQYAIFPFLLILLILLLAASHTLWSLLEISDAGSELQNNYKSFGHAIFATLWWVTGDPGSIQPFEWFAPADAFRAIFSCIYIIILLNVLIALLNVEYEKAAKRGLERYQLIYMQIIAEMEVFYMLPSEREDPKNFPLDVFFEAEEESIREWLASNKQWDEVSSFDQDFCDRDSAEGALRSYLSRSTSKT